MVIHHQIIVLMIIIVINEANFKYKKQINK
jgi:hypothetical protein